jgi:hypothetical protein
MPYVAFKNCLAALAAIALLAMPGSAQNKVAKAPAKTQALGREVVISAPQFIVEAIKIKANDESGYTDWGSDEVYAILVDFDPIKERATATHGDVDTGDTITLSASERCISRQPDCTRGRSAVHFAVALWEADPSVPALGGFCAGTFEGLLEWYNDGKCSTDDLIGRVEVAIPQADLLAAMPNVGDTYEETVKESGGDGSYSITYRITRLADVQRTIVIHLPPIPPTTVTITLQATPDDPADPNAINLAWSGATTANVDIYRNGALRVTTANTGSYADPVTPGTFTYRVCNAGSTSECSPQVQVVVP